MAIIWKYKIDLSDACVFSALCYALMTEKVRQTPYLLPFQSLMTII